MNYKAIKDHIMPSTSIALLLTSTFLAASTNKPAVAVATGIAAAAMGIYTGISVRQALNETAGPSR